jgi:HK97 family phage prohead protease
VIKPEAAQMAFLNTQDIKLNLLHDRHDTIARCKEGVGNMTISVDQNGVNFEAEMPRCDLGDRALEMVRAGVYTGCSFEFIPDKYEAEERGDQVLITHERFQKVLAFTLAMDPAYQQTSVNARELVTDHSEEEKKAEAEKEREAKERELKREREKSAAMRRMRDREAEAQDF